MRRDKIRHHFLELAEDLDAQLANTQKVQCEEAQALALDLKETLQRHLARLSIGSKSEYRANLSTHQNSSWVETARSNQIERILATPLTATQPRHIGITQTEKTRLFIRIAKQHIARKLAPFVILQKLCDHLPCEAQISEVRAVPTGF